MAVIQNLADGSEHVVRAGESIGSGKITAIGRNYIELDGAAGHDLLKLPSGEMERVRAGETADRRDGDGNILVIDRETLRDLVTRVDALSSEITLQPVRHADGSGAGFRITAIKPRGLLARMGLQKDDTLLAVNSNTIQTVEDAFRIMESTIHQNTLSLAIRRNQQKMELTYVIR